MSQIGLPETFPVRRIQSDRYSHLQRSDGAPTGHGTTLTV